jgi:hypothetical protein
MPGIAGIISQRPSEDYYRLVRSMVKCLVHEPFYTEGTYITEELGLWLGWANHEESFADCLPIWNEKKDICLLFSGEDFADQTEIDAFRMRGHEFGSDDASYLVHLYEARLLFEQRVRRERTSTRLGQGFCYFGSDVLLCSRSRCPLAALCGTDKLLPKAIS